MSINTRINEYSLLLQSYAVNIIIHVGKYQNYHFPGLTYIFQVFCNKNVLSQCIIMYNFGIVRLK